MIVSHSRKYAFVHVAKCGGESVELACSPTLAKGDILIGRRHEASVPFWISVGRKVKPLRAAWRASKGLFKVRDKGATLQDTLLERETGLHKHSTASEMRQAIGPELYDSYFTFATIRRPEERIYSLFKWGVALGRFGLRNTARFSECVVAGASWRETVADFRKHAAILDGDEDAFLNKQGSAKEFPEFQDGALSYWPVKAALISPSFDEFFALFADPRSEAAMAKRSLIDLLCDPDTGELLVDETIALHELNDKWPAIAERIGAPSVLPHENVGHHRAIDPLSDDAREKVREFYRADIDRFGL